MKEDIWSISISDDETRETIKSAWGEYKLLLEPHGAVGWAGLNSFESAEKYSCLSVSVETAHPAKFPEEIEQLLGFSPDAPDSLTSVEKKSESFLSSPVDYGKFKSMLIEHYGTNK
jgi:threonine synthase